MSVCECYLPVVCECVRQSPMEILIEPSFFHRSAVAIDNHDQFVDVDADAVRYRRVWTYSIIQRGEMVAPGCILVVVIENCGSMKAECNVDNQKVARGAHRCWVAVIESCTTHTRCVICNET